VYDPFVPVTFREACKIASGSVRSMPLWSRRHRIPTHDVCTAAKLDRITQERSGRRAPRGQAVVAADEVVGGWRIRPIPRGIGETAYVTAPNAMIESTLMTQSRIVIAVASGSGTP
jgi:hypothetical protein